MAIVIGLKVSPAQLLLTTTLPVRCGLIGNEGYRAYTVFPRIALGQPENFERGWRHPLGQHPGRMLENKDKLVWHQGHLSDAREYVVIEYPTPSQPGSKTVDEMEALHAQGSTPIMGPYFSAWMTPPPKTPGPGECYALGQSPWMDGPPFGK